MNRRQALPRAAKAKFSKNETSESGGSVSKKTPVQNRRTKKVPVSNIKLKRVEKKVAENIEDSHLRNVESKIIIEDSHLRNIESKINHFMKSTNLLSDDEDDVKSTNQSVEKPKDFYLVISDSEDETTIPTPFTYADNDIPDTTNSIVSIFNDDGNGDEIMNIADNILQPDDLPQKSYNPDYSWEEYKKKTEQALNSASKTMRGLSRENRKEAASCAICFNTFGEEETAATSCGHIFCKLCIISAIETMNRCPKCRKHLYLDNIYPVYF